jgi:aminocarboxymuconate-semialdehyde decarboxylase
VDVEASDYVSNDPMRIDCHNHVMPRLALELVKSTPAFGLRVVGGQLQSDRHPPIAIVPSFTDPAAKLEELHACGLDAAVVSINPPLFAHAAPSDAAEQLCRATNEGLADFCAADPDHLRWMAHVPLQAPERALAVLADAVTAGCAGVAICTLIGGRRPDSAEFEAFWARVEQLGLPIFLHPGEDNPEYPGMHEFFLQNIVGNQLETTIAIERLICAGVLEKHARLRLLLPHGGGYFPIQAGRLRHARLVRPELSSTGSDPWSHRGQIMVDTVTHDVEALRYVVERMGPENVVLGTDLPTPMAATEMWTELEAAVGTDLARVVGQDNPAQLFGFA